MKRVFDFFFFIIPFLCHASQAEVENTPSYRTSVEVRPAVFIPQSEHLRDIYGTVWPDVGLQAEFYSNHWAAFLDIDFRLKQGHSLGLDTTTRARIFTFTAGPKYFFIPYASISPYLGLGVGAAYVIFKDNSSFVSEIHRWGFAALFKFGVEVALVRKFFADFFADYNLNAVSYGNDKNNVKKDSVQTGGLKIGVGLGGRF